MITANELRVGNIVRLNQSKLWNDDSKGTLHTITVNDFCIQSNGVYDWEQMDYVALTPEIIEQCGFEKEDITTHANGGTQQGYYKDFIMMLPVASGKAWYAAPFGYPLAPQRTFYLHQLQNLYFALTGKELTVNL